MEAGKVLLNHCRALCPPPRASAVAIGPLDANTVLVATNVALLIDYRACVGKSAAFEVVRHSPGVAGLQSRVNVGNGYMYH